MKKIVIIVGLVLIASVLLLPPVLGSMTQANFEQTLARSAAQSSGVMDFKIVNYDRGWFASRADLRINFTDAYLDTNPAFASSEPGVVEVRDALAHGVTQSVDVVHGPLLFGQVPGMGLGEITTEFNGADNTALQAVLAKTGNAYFIKSTSRIGFAGRGPITVEMPGFDLANPQLDIERLFFAGMQASGTMDYHDLHVVLEGAMAGFSVASKAADFVVEPVTFAMDLATPDTAPYGIGSGRITVDAITGIVGDTFAVDIDNITVEFASVRNDNDTATISARYFFDQARLDQATIADAEFSVRMLNLNTAAWMQLQQQANANPSAQQYPSAEPLTGPVYDLLKDGAALSLDPIKFNYDGQTFSATLDVTTRPENLPPRAEFSFANPLLLINLFKLDMTLLIDKNLATILAVSQLKNQLAAGIPEGTTIDATQLQQMAEAQAPIMFSTLVGQGLLKDKGANYSMSAQYDNGEMTVNGHPLPTAQMLNPGTTP